MKRRLRVIVVSIIGLMCGPLAAQQLDLRLTPIGPEVLGTVDIVHAGDGSGRLFLVQQVGRIRVLRNGALASTPFLDIVDRVRSSSSEQGLLSAVFPPDFAQKRYFYVYYTDLSGRSVLDRYTTNADGSAANPASRTEILSFAQPFDNHNGGKLLFGPDGMLYLSSGDGGSGNDPLNNAQNRGSLLGKMIRIDTESGSATYRIPPDNPFADGVLARPEIWALGLRNPWRTSFDPATGELYIADVGQSRREEINIQPPGAGGRNYGWKVFEGTRCATNQAECSALSEATPPAFEYSHDAGDCSITGGHVYRGTRYPRMVGAYFYGDYCTGRIWTLTRNGAAVTSRLQLDTAFAIASFGTDEQGELYVTDSEHIYLVSDGAPVSFAINPGITGTWYDPAQDGHGLIIEVLPGNQLIVAWFTYAPNGGQSWITGAGSYSGNRAEIDAVIPQGGRFIPNFNPSAIQRTPWGRLTLTFDDCRNGRVDFSSTAGYGSGTMRLTRLTQPAAVACN